MRHSASHVMAAAVCRLYPDVRLDIGPATSDGFYYDFDMPHRLTPEDFPAIEAEMRKLIEADLPFERVELSRAEAEALFQKTNQTYKLERISDIPEDEAITLYRTGRGPHVASTGQVGVFKLLTVAGSYFRGLETNPMLQRLYGTAFATTGELEAYIKQLEEARQGSVRAWSSGIRAVRGSGWRSKTFGAANTCVQATNFSTPPTSAAVGSGRTRGTSGSTARACTRRCRSDRKSVV